MKTLVVVLLLAVAVSVTGDIERQHADGYCNKLKTLQGRHHSVSILEFGAVGDGKTLNTVAFQNAIFYLKSFADKGGAMLYVPSGKWLTGSFNLTSHLTLFLEKDSVILASQDIAHWKVIDSLPSYGPANESTGARYRSLINGYNLIDVVITGDRGTIDGQGSVWWDNFNSHTLNYSRPHLVEFVDSSHITISNLTFLNSPAWTIHPVYCSDVHINKITARAPPESPYTSGVVPDSSENVCIENSDITTSHDAIALKSGWDEYGISYAKPTRKVHIRGVIVQSSSGAGLAVGSEMSGGISDILIEHVRLNDSLIGIHLKTIKGRGGYMVNILVSDVEMKKVYLAIGASGNIGSHLDDKFDAKALPVVNGITLKNIIGSEILVAGNLSGLRESPFSSICLSNITLSMKSTTSASWFCSNVKGFSVNVSPPPCSNLLSSSSSHTCYSMLHPYIQSQSFLS